MCTSLRTRLSNLNLSFLRKVSLAGIEPVGFRVKSDLRNHQAIVQPRLYDSLMVTQITLGLLTCELKVPPLVPSPLSGRGLHRDGVTADSPKGPQ